MSNLFSSGGAGNVGFSGETQQSLKFNDDESQYLSWTPASAGNRQTWTWSGWFKRANLSAAEMDLFSAGNSSTDRFEVILSSAYPDQLEIYMNTSGTVGDLVTTQVFRDVSAWYHLVIAFDTTQATASNRVKIYVNGSQVTAFNTATYPSLNFNTAVNSTSGQFFSKRNYVDDRYYDGYLADVYMIDGQALDASSFGQFTNGYWKKKDYAGTYGTNGFHLTFEDDVVSEGFNAVTYTGTGAAQSISGLGFQPDFVWFKARSASIAHLFYDSVRGATKYLQSNSTSAEGTEANSQTSFDGDGFSVGADSTTGVNQDNTTYVGWCWEAGGTPTANNTAGAGATPTAGSVKIDGSNLGSALAGSLPVIELTAKTAMGFSICRWNGTSSDGATIAHGLGTAPSVIITKSMSNATSWVVGIGGISGFGASDYLTLQTDGAKGTSSTFYQSYDTSTFTVGVSAANEMNKTGNGYISYCFAEVANYSSIGSYSGTGASGNAVTGLGFKPAFLMVKRTDSTSNWAMYDNTRSTTNPRRKNVWANLSDFEYDNSAYDIDFDADGFTLQTSDSQRNASGGTYIYLAVADTREAAFWKDVSGQGNHWTPNNLDYRDSLIDSPANNFAVLNLLSKDDTSVVYSEGNLQAINSTATSRRTYSTIAVKAGKWYFEYYVNAIGSSTTSAFGVQQATDVWADGLRAYRANGDYFNGSGWASYGATFTTGDIISFAVDYDSDTIEFFKNNVSQGQKTSVGFDTSYDYVALINLVSGFKATVNFGQDSSFAGNHATANANADENGHGSFAYAPPSGGFLALCSQNLPTPTIVDGSEHFNTVLYTGTGATQSITGVGFGSAPDLVWVKNRSNAYHHGLFDSVRGANKVLKSSDTSAEATFTEQLTSFDADGFSLGDNSDSGNYVNISGHTYAAWNWKAGGTAVSNTSGSITSQVSANTDAGFSVVSWTGNGTGGSTIGHGLSGVDAVIVKRRDSASHWQYLDKNLASGNVLLMSSTGAAAAYSGFSGGGIDNLAATTFSVENGSLNCDNVNASGGTYIAYCFANSDIIKAGSYTGNGNADGPFVFTGGRVQWLLLKNASASENWYIWDNARETFNIMNERQHPNLAIADQTSSGRGLDFLSSGFKIRGSDSSVNGSGNIIIYLAIMESPLKHSNAR